MRHPARLRPTFPSPLRAAVAANRGHRMGPMKLNGMED